MSETDVSTVLPLDGDTLAVGSGFGPVIADQLERLTGRAPILVRNAKRTVERDAVRVEGRASLLNVADMPAVATAAGPGMVAVRFTLPGDWRFSRSFPDLPPFNGGESGNGDLLDRLLLSGAAFVLASAAGTDPVTGAPFQAGLNFVARCGTAGLLGLLGSIVDGGLTVALSGPILVPKPTERPLPLGAKQPLRLPWEPGRNPPGILLSADLGIDRKVGPALLFHDIGLRIYSPPARAWTDADPSLFPVVAAAGTLEVPSAGLKLDLSGLGLPSRNLLLFGRFEGVSLESLAQLADLAGAGDLADRLPVEVRSQLSSLSLEAVTLQLGPDFEPSLASVTVGLPGIGTAAAPDLSLTGSTAVFGVFQPFGPGRSLEAALGGTLRFLGTSFDAMVDLPEGSVRARLADGIDLPLSRLFGQVGLPAPPGLPDLRVDELQMEASKGSWSIAARMAESPAWSLPLGPSRVTVQDLVLVAGRPAGSSAQGSFGGRISLGEDLDLALALDLPGGFVLRSRTPDLRLSDLVRGLTGQAASLPAGFDPDLTGSSVVIQEGSAGLAFQLATTVAGVGTVAFEARRTAGSTTGSSAWGFAAGVDLAAPRLSALPGLEGLKPIEDALRLDGLVLAVSSFADPGFQFAGLAAFVNPALPASGPRLPAHAGGLAKGLNAYGRWTLDTSGPHRALRNLLGLGPTVDVTLQVGATPSEDSRLFAGFGARVLGLPLAGQLGVELRSGKPSLFVDAVLEARVEGQPVKFGVTAAFVPNGVFLSGTMAGTVQFQGLTLSDLTLQAGMSLEGVPTLGILATLQAVRFQASLAVLFDSTDPSSSLLAGSVSDLTLADAVAMFAGSKVPRDLAALLGKVALAGSAPFNLDAGLATHLDNRDLGKISEAFQSRGVTLPSDSSAVLVLRAAPGGSWSVTDLSTLAHYRLVKTAAGIQVSRDARIYCAPRKTSLGTRTFEEGFFLEATLNLFSFAFAARVQVSPGQGISIDAQFPRIVIGTEKLFSVTSATGTGPRLSVSTFAQPAASDRSRREPHVVIDGTVTLLGLRKQVLVRLTSGGFAFGIGGTLLPGVSGLLEGRFSGPGDLEAGGSLQIGIGTVDLGDLGKVKIDAGANGKLDVRVGKAITATFQAGFAFAGKTLNLPRLSLDVNSAALADLPATVRGLVTAALREALQPEEWARSVRTGVVQGVQDVGRVLRDTFGMDMHNAAAVLRRAGFDSQKIGAVLKQSFAAAPDLAVGVLRMTGFQVAEIGTVLRAVYNVDPNQAALFLRFAGGFAAVDITFVLRKMWSASAELSGHAMKSADFSLDDLGKALQQVFGLAPAPLSGTLQTVGFPPSEIARLFRSMGAPFDGF